MGGIPSLVIGGKGLLSDNVMLEGTTSEVGVILERHNDDDEDSSWMTSFFYPPRSRTIPKSGLIWLCLLLKCIYLALPSCTP